MRDSQRLVFSLALGLGLLLSACVGTPQNSDGSSEERSAGVTDAAPVTELQGLAAQRAFFQHLADRCGDEYPGRAIIAPPEDDVFHPAYLRMRIDSCTDQEIRIVFPVDDDETRTWVLALEEEGLLFTHEHMQEDGTLTDNSGWGGWATDEGTEWFQHFPDHRWTPEVAPEERRSHWRLRLDPQHGQFVYYLDRGVTPAYRLVFFMGQDPALQDG